MTGDLPNEVDIFAPAKRTISAYTLLMHFNAGMTVAELRPLLKSYNVAKGTISKMETVLTGLWAGTIRPEQVTSLNAAYAILNRKPDEEIVKRWLREQLGLRVALGTLPLESKARAARPGFKAELEALDYILSQLFEDN